MALVMLWSIIPLPRAYLRVPDSADERIPKNKQKHTQAMIVLK
jgi:hypothetical protein